MRPVQPLFLALGLLLVCGMSRADPAADALIQKALQAAAHARTLEADFTRRIQLGSRGGVFTGTVRLMKPNYARLQINTAEGQDDMLLISDGKDAFMVRPPLKQCWTMRAAPKGMVGFSYVDLPAAIFAFFDPESLKKIPAHHVAGPRQVNGTTYQVVEFPTREEVPGTARYFFGPSGLLEGVEIVISDKTTPGTHSYWLTNVRLDVPLTPQQFAYVPPSDFRVSPLQKEPLLPLGSKAPEFRLPAPRGGQMSLSGLRKGKKAVLVNFWFYGCGPCREEFPHLQKIYDELKDKGLELVAVNRGDSADVINRYVEANKFSFPILMGGRDPAHSVDKAYGVTDYPTNYLIGPDGTVLWRGDGFREESLRRALARAGLQ
jgi:peroxiredoxin/outer membrane lipoprotein-sorting protein